MADVVVEGVVQRDGDWVYAEFAEGGDVTGIGLDEPALPGLPASAASGPLPPERPAASGVAMAVAPPASAASRPALQPR